MADEIPVVKSGYRYRTRGIFLGFEPRGVSIRQEGAAGSCVVFPESTFQGGVETGGKIVLTWEHRFSEAKRTGMGLQASNIRNVLIDVMKDEGQFDQVPMAKVAGGKQGQLTG